MNFMRPRANAELFSGLPACCRQGLPMETRPTKRDEVPSQELGRDLVTEGDGLVSIHRIEMDIRE